MERAGLVLVLAVGFLSTSVYGFQLSGRKFITKTDDKASSSVGNQRQNDSPLNIPENAYPVENSHISFTCRQDGLYAYPLDCTLGVSCVGGIGHIFTCTDILHFNNVTKECDNFCSAHCDPLLACECGWDSCQTSNSFMEESPSDKVARKKARFVFDCFEDGFYPDPRNCSKFIHCFDGTAYFRKCQSGLYFHGKTKLCKRAKPATCAQDKVTEPPPKLDIIDDLEEEKPLIFFTCKRDGLFASPEHCNEYYECSRGRIYFRRCRPGLHFNKKLKTCDTPCKAKCDPNIRCPRQRSESVSIESPLTKHFASLESSKKFFNLKFEFLCSADDSFSDPKDCSKYKNCSNGIAYELSCPPGRHFNNETRQCEALCSAKCDPNLICNWRESMFRFEEANLDICTYTDDTFYAYFAPECQIYYKCEAREFNKFRCPDGQHFNYKTFQCEEPCSARCDRFLECPRERAESASIESPLTKHFTTLGSFKKFSNLKFAFVCFDDGLFPNPKDCSKYINCSNGTAYELSCPPSRHFNNETKQCEALCSAQCDPNLICDWQESMQRFEEVNVDVCINTNDTFYTVFPHQCQIYYKCEAREFNKFRCPDGLHFSHETSRCEEPCNARCDSSLAKECGFEENTESIMEFMQDFCKSDKDNFEYRRSHECDYYFKCERGEISIVHCPDGQHSNNKTLRCEEPCVARCDISLAEQCGWENTTEPEIVATEMSPREDNAVLDLYEVMPEVAYRCHDGDFYPDHRNCHIFYECAHGRILIHLCFPGYYYNRKTNKCDASAPCLLNKTESAEPETPVTEDFRSSVSTVSSRKIFKLKVTFVCFDDGLFPNRRDCSKYINCSNGNAYELSCPPGRHFNNVTKQCETFCSAKCDPNLTEECGWKSSSESEIASRDPVTTHEVKSTKELCSEDGTYLERNPLDCKSYFNCMDGDADLFFCPDGEHFNPETLLCEEASQAQCDITMAEKSGRKYTTEPQKVLSNSLKQPVFDFECPGDGLYANIACENFIQCTDGQAYLINCPYGLHYEPETQRCISPCKARCDPNYEIFCKDEEKERAPKQLLRDFDCQTDGYHVNPLDCGSFIQCFKGEAYAIYCPEGLHYSPTLGICMSRCDAKCAPNYEEYCRAEESKRRRKLQHTHNSPAKQPFPLVSEYVCAHDGDFPNPEDCNSYITCKSGESYYKDCPDGTHFSATSLSCMSVCEAECQPSLACECDWDTCEQGEVVEASDDVDCGAELDEGPCMGRVARYAYDVWSGRCRGFFYGGCGGNSNNFRTMEECETRCRKKLLRGYRCPADTGMFGHYPDCLSYYHCKRGEPTLKKCPKGKAFDHKRSKCVKEHEATCVYECRDRDAVYPYEEDCRKYIDCVNGISKLETCPPGKAFDPDEKDCIDEKRVRTCFWKRIELKNELTDFELK